MLVGKEFPYLTSTLKQKQLQGTWQLQAVTTRWRSRPQNSQQAQANKTVTGSIAVANFTRKMAQQTAKFSAGQTVAGSIAIASFNHQMA